ncbi:putative F-box/FBD/LRR-repeat protein At4g13965 [Salvia miltiorrhiza]|uniref:putative F-box/FBD/LRR-repeat protein At4g13965 n=1 Tax=Salvia miltiorrhiza TaxID=226208 RepID=UPI0025AD4E05|nr:putative F-box/FBD/LRR-repeat protein At4g13965 [Salvia miltiorrhiza]
MDDSDFLPKKSSRRCDRISELPDEIILVILSFLSLRESVTTSVLSSRWSDLWKHTPNLNLDAKLLTNRYKKPIEIINSVLQSHKAPSLNEFRISLYVNYLEQRAVAKWLEFVVSRQVERLELDLLGTELEVPIFKVSLLELLRERPQNLIGFKSLKSLCLKGFLVSGEVIDSFLRNCPLLKQLDIHSSTLTSDVVICGTALALEELDIYRCAGQYSIQVSAPNLTCLRVHSTSKKLLACAVFSCISRLKTLSLTIRRPKAFLGKAFPQMPMLKKLFVGYGRGAYKDGLLPVTALIRASPHLQEFMFRPTSKARWREVATNVERHPHWHLKVFKFGRFLEGAGGHLELLKYILDTCIALEKIILRCSSKSRFFLKKKSKSRFLYKQEAYPQAARDLLEKLLGCKLPDNIQLYIV